MHNSSNEDSLLNRLIEVSTFGLDDLELNREGKMSGLQRSRLVLVAVFYSIAGTFIFILTIGIAWLLAMQWQSVPIVITLAVIIIFAYSSFYWLRHAVPMWQDVRAGTVLCVSGPMYQIYTPIRSHPRIYTLHYRITKKFFNIALFAPQVIPEDQICHAYYTPRSEILVGIEPV